MRKILRTGYGLIAAALSAKAATFDPDKFLLFQKGPTLLKPQLQVSGTFNDNITFRDEKRKADFIATISPGLAFQLGRKDGNIVEISYFYDRLQYFDNTVFNAHQHRIANRLRVQKRYLTLEGSDSIEFMSSPIGGGYSASAGEQIEGITGLAGAKVDRGTFFDLYRLSWTATERTDLYVQALHSFLDYQDDLPLFDSRTLSGTLGFQYGPLSKTYFFGETYYGQTENEHNLGEGADYPTASFAGFFVGSRGEFTERIRGTAKAGFEHRYYSDDGDTLNAPVVELSVDAQLSERTLITAGYSRRQYESIQFVRSPYTTDSISLSWLQQIGGDERLRAIARAAYITSDFEETGDLSRSRSDQMLTGSLTLSYDIKIWMRAFGSYNFEHLSSDEPAIVEYNVNRVTVGLQIGY